MDGYFAGLSAERTPTSGYNRNGRGYPDVSLIGANYEIIVQSVARSVYGTIISLIAFGVILFEEVSLFKEAY